MNLVVMTLARALRVAAWLGLVAVRIRMAKRLCGELVGFLFRLDRTCLNLLMDNGQYMACRFLPDPAANGLIINHVPTGDGALADLFAGRAETRVRAIQIAEPGMRQYRPEIEVEFVEWPRPVAYRPRPFMFKALQLRSRTGRLQTDADSIFARARSGWTAFPSLQSPGPPAVRRFSNGLRVLRSILARAHRRTRVVDPPGAVRMGPKGTSHKLQTTIRRNPQARVGLTAGVCLLDSGHRRRQTERKSGDATMADTGEAQKEGLKASDQAIKAITGSAELFVGVQGVLVLPAQYKVGKGDYSYFNFYVGLTAADESFAIEAGISYAETADKQGWAYFINAGHKGQVRQSFGGHPHGGGSGVLVKLLLDGKGGVTLYAGSRTLTKTDIGLKAGRAKLVMAVGEGVAGGKTYHSVQFSETKFDRPMYRKSLATEWTPWSACGDCRDIQLTTVKTLKKFPPACSCNTLTAGAAATAGRGPPS